MKKMIFIGGCVLDGTKNQPKIGQPVTVSQCSTFATNYDIEGYKVHDSGLPQSFHKINFTEVKTLSVKLVEQLKNNPEWVKKTPQEMDKVFTLNAEF